MSDAKSPELLPCPFCGGVAESANYAIEAVARCSSCHAKIVRRHGTYEDTGSPASKEAWNTRADLLTPTWQLMAKAPKDKTILIFDGYCVQTGYWDQSEGWLHDMESSGGFNYYDTISDASHWMPLPEPPQ